MAMFYNDQQAQIPWQGLPPMARPSPQGQSQIYSGLPATATANASIPGPVVPPSMARPGNEMMKARENRPFWGGLPSLGPRQYGGR